MKKFELHRNDSNDWDLVDEVTGDDERAKELFRTVVQRVSNPSTVSLVEVIQEGEDVRYTTRSDIMDLVAAEADIDDVGRIDMETPISMNTARKIGFSLQAGANWYDYAYQPMTLSEMAQMEARSMQEATQRNLTTSVDLSHGMYVSWSDDADPRIRSMYEARLHELLRAPEA